MRGHAASGTVIWKLLATILVLLLLAGAGGYTYEKLGGQSDRMRLPMPGKLHPVGTHRLHLHCVGSGPQTILLESGWSMPSAIWVRTLPLLARHTRTCVYDRAGYGWSEESPAARSAAQSAAEAELLLEAAGIEKPVVLVGHSYGGVVARLLAKRVPERVAGLVLVDAVHEDMFRALPLVKARVEERQGQIEAAPYLARFGLFRLAPGMFEINKRGPEFAALTDAEWDVIRTFRALPRQVTATLAELLLFETSLEQARAAGRLGELPVVVLSAGMERKPNWVPADYSDEDYFSRWSELQKKLCGLTDPPAPRLIAEESSHEIPVQSPELVERAVLQVLEQIAGRQKRAAMFASE